MEDIVFIVRRSIVELDDRGSGSQRILDTPKNMEVE